MLSLSWAVNLGFSGVLSTENLLDILPDSIQQDSFAQNLIHQKSQANQKQFIGTIDGVYVDEVSGGPVFAPVTQLIYSNHPESIHVPGLIYQSSVVNGAARLLFFHKNATADDGFIRISVLPVSAEKIWARGSAAGPNESELFVGQMIGLEFFRHENTAFRLNLPFQKTFTLKRNMIQGGIFDLIPIPRDGAYRVQVEFITTFDAPPATVLYGSNDVYNITPVVKTIDLVHEYKTYPIRFGEDEILIGNSELFGGSYGVPFEFRYIFHYPGEYEIFFTANGGPAGIAMKWDDQVVHAFTKDLKPLKTIWVEKPSELRIRTFPLPGSNYPVTLTMRKKS